MMPFQPHLGKIIATGAGLLAVYSFAAMLWISLGIFGNYTAVQVAQFASQVLHTQQLTYLWLELLLSVALTLLALTSFFTQTKEQMFSIVIIGLGAVGFISMIAIYVFLSQQVIPLVSISLTALLGSGFWLYTISIVIATTGGIIQLTSFSRRRKQSFIGQK
jgi:hypothetical protein